MVMLLQKSFGQEDIFSPRWIICFLLTALTNTQSILQILIIKFLFHTFWESGPIEPNFERRKICRIDVWFGGHNTFVIEWIGENLDMVKEQPSACYSTWYSPIDFGRFWYRHFLKLDNRLMNQYCLSWNIQTKGYFHFHNTSTQLIRDFSPFHLYTSEQKLWLSRYLRLF